MRSASIVMLIVMLIGGGLAAGVPAAFAGPESEGLGNKVPGVSQSQPSSAARPTATSGVPAGAAAGVVNSGHAELK